MDPDRLFSLASGAAALGWALLILAPRRWPPFVAIPALALPAALSALYSVLVLTSFSGASGSFGSIAEVRALFADDRVLLAGWVHYLAFDLMVGALLAGRMDRAGVGRLVQAPLLALVFLFGPLGALLALLTEGALRLRAPAPLPLLARPA